MKDIRMFNPGVINGVSTKNRLIRSATNDHLGNPDGIVSDEEIEMQTCIGDDRYSANLYYINCKLWKP